MQQQTVSISRIQLGANPRRFFDDGELEQLVDSIRKVGLLQPIVVRESAGGVFELVAGERRLRAWKQIHGDDSEIPVTIHQADLDIELAALVENTLRADMSPTEEAAAAYALVMRLHGDVDEACRRLAWRPEFLKRRLALMAACPEVRQALNERKILLGHAELLASIPKERQEKALKAVLAHNIPVSELKTQLANYAQELATAIFDKGECGTCPYNSDQQSSLFSEAINTGRCTNPQCFAEKTHEALELRAKALEQGGKYPVVRLVSAEQEGTYTTVDASTVGDEQIVACRSCAHFGATVSESPATLGEVTEGICFDLSCNAGKVEAYRKARAVTPPPAPAPLVDTEDEEEQTSAGTATAVPSPTVSAASGKAAAPAGIRPSSALIEYRRAAWNLAAQKYLVQADVAKADAVLAVAVATHNVGNARVTDAVKAVLSTDHPTVADVWAVVDPAAASDTRHDRVRKALAYAICQALSVENFRTVVIHGLGVELHHTWKIDSEFLGLLTKGDLKTLADEIGVPQTPGMFSGKKADCITEFLAAEGKGFAFAGIVPEVMKL
ncbi:PRTRC system ParB family protein [Acidithiobacillus caldus ATCC 51756]|uniref:PRTRC system ParB family protein n=1 Tax=Acidithiobacillus caldus TaxID=33059 RepID=UPI001C07D8D6|nr:PRTRC system ParB family protein [Acidithiobacillus caldus]MBU2736366.1 PRTRC system ParB family protein [Acidithiobacillus caldus ATCC 51756]